MTPNELTHNATSDHENRPMAPLAAVTFTVDSSGNITGDADACEGDSFAVNNAPNETYTGAIYAVHVNGNVNKTQQLITQNSSSMAVGTTYTLKRHTNAHTYTITSIQPTNALTGQPMDTTNGTLRVGSGGTDDDDGDDDGHDSGGHQ